MELRLSPSYLANSSHEDKFELKGGLDTRLQFQSRNNQSSLINVKDDRSKGSNKNLSIVSKVSKRVSQ